MNGNAPPDGEQQLLLSLCQTYLEDIGRVGARHEALRTFYVSVMSEAVVISRDRRPRP